MATAGSPLNDEGYWTSDEKSISVAERQKTNRHTSISQDSNSDFEIEELCCLLAELTLCMKHYLRLS
jgi:hypothetical protein